MCERQRVACCAGPVATADTRRRMMYYLDIVSWASQCLRRLVKAYSDKSEKSRRYRHFHCSLQAWHCNSLYHNLPKSQITRLQQILNSLACAVVKAPKSSHITPIPRSLHWLKDNRAHWIQAPVTYLHSSHNHPTFISAWPRHSSASLQQSLFTGHNRSSIYIIVSKNNRSFLPVCFSSSMDSTPGSPSSTTH